MVWSCVTLLTLGCGNYYGIFLIPGLFSNQGEKSINVYFIMVPLREKVLKYGTPKPRFWVMQDLYHQPYESFRNLGVPYFGVLIIRILLFRVLY